MAMTAPRSAAALATALAAALALAGCGEKRGSVKVEGGGTGTAATSTSGTATSGATATGETATAGTATAPAAPVATVRVVEREFTLAPARARVAKPGLVRVVARNAGRVAHAIEVEGPDGEVRSGTIAPGRSATIRVNLPKRGRYTWYCPVDGHRERGMRGTITVGGGSGAGGSTGGGAGAGGGGGSSGGAAGPAGRGY